MSAIAGVWYRDGRPGAGADCERVQRALSDYGPDRAGLWDGGEIALGSRLLRLLPEDRFDRQPLIGRGGGLVLVADVRIDNRDELCAALGISGAEAARLCDADVLLAALERWGEAAVDRLAGDFAFAAWDARDRVLLIARDHVDARPLHYHAGHGWFAFASMPKGLLALPDIGRGVDRRRLAQWQLLWPSEAGRSFYEEVQRLEPGHLARIAPDGTVSLRRHWRPEERPILRLAREDDYAEGLRAVFDEAVRARLRSAGGAALLLSGGLDSSAVAAAAAPILAARGERLTAITSVPLPDSPALYVADARIDEGPPAAPVAARHPNIDHHLIRAFDADLLAEIERMILFADQPVMNPLNTAWLGLGYGLAARRGNSTVLVGTKGNLGVSYTGQHALIELARSRRWLTLLHETRALRRNGHDTRPEYRLSDVLRQTLSPHIPKAIARWRRHPILEDLYPIAPALLRGLGFDGAGDNRLARATFPPIQSWRDWLTLMLRLTDAGPMNAAIRAAHRVDRRDPTADRRVLEFCMATPANVFLRDGEPKRLFRRAFGARIPEAVLNDRRRGIPLADWKTVQLKARDAIAGELGRQAETEACRDVVDIDTLLALVATLDGASSGERGSYYRHHLKLMRGLSTGLFTRKASGGNA